MVLIITGECVLISELGTEKVGTLSLKQYVTLLTPAVLSSVITIALDGWGMESYFNSGMCSFSCFT